MFPRIIKIDMPDGSVWHVDTDIVAKHRAEYYSSLESNLTLKEKIFNEEYSYAMSNKYELIDWAKNNMNWDELHAVKVQDAVEPNYEDLFCSASLNVI
jgi:hypothetical protein